mgnify:CR=1 FL=1
MKFKRCMSAIYSSAFVLGLSFLLYPQATTANVDGPNPTSAVTSTATPAPTAPIDNSVSDQVPELTPDTTAPTATPTVPYMSLLTGALSPPISGVSDLVTAYITSYYDNDFETVSSLVTDATLLNASLMENNSKNVAKVEDITLYAKPGIDGIFSIVYATYSLYYSDIQISVPQFSEYYVKRLADGTFRIHTVPLSAKTMDVFAQARQTEDVLKLSISALIRRYHNACLAANEPLLKQCVTNSDYLNLDYIASRYSVTESFSDYNFILYPGINEFDYIAFVTHNEKYYQSLYEIWNKDNSCNLFLGIVNLDKIINKQTILLELTIGMINFNKNNTTTITIHPHNMSVKFLTVSS